MKMVYFNELKKQIEDSRLEGEDFETSITYLPDMFSLLCDMLDENILTQEDRMLVNSAIAYLVVPSDVLPEDVYGARGFMDDLFVCCVVFKELMKRYPDLLRKHWANTVDTEEFDKVLDLCYFRSNQAMDEENIKQEVLEYAGLAPPEGTN